MSDRRRHGATLVLPRSVDLQRRDRVGSSGDRLNKMCDVLLEARDSQLRLDRTFRQRGERDGSPTVGAAAERATGVVRSVRASAEIHNEVHLQEWEDRGGERRDFSRRRRQWSAGSRTGRSPPLPAFERLRDAVAGTRH